MFKLFVCVLLVNYACAAPGLVGHYPGVSHVARIDVHDSKPILAGYGAGYGSGYASPYGYHSVPYSPYSHTGHYGGYSSGLGYGYGGYPAAHSYSNRIDIHASPIVTPVLGHGYEHPYGHGYGLHDGGYGLALSGYGIHGLHHAY